MKFKDLILPCFATLAMTSCVSNDTPDVLVGEAHTVEVTLNAIREGFTPEVRSQMTENENKGIDFSWSEGDEILVTYNNGSEAGKLTYIGNDGNGAAGIFRGKLTVYGDNPTFNYYFLGGEGSKDIENLTYTVNLKNYGTDAAVYAANDVLMARQENVMLKGDQLNTTAKLTRPFAFHRAVFKFPVTVPVNTKIVYNAKGLKTTAAISLKDATKELTLGEDDNMTFITSKEGTEFAFYFFVAPGQITERSGYCKIGEDVYVATKNELQATVNDNFISTFNMVKEEKTYALTVNAYDNNGTADFQSETKNGVAETKFPYSFDLNFDEPTYEGHIFKGWAFSENATANDVMTKVEFTNPDVLTKNVYAVWEDDEWVDFNLPSGLLWNKYNIGADSPEKSGNYYGWGDISGNKTSNLASSYGPSNRPSDAIARTETSYNTIYYHIESTNDKYLSLYDIAYNNKGHDCFMPSPDDFDELYENTIVTKTSYNNVQGWKFVDKQDKDKWIFIPSAGYKISGEVKSNGCMYIWSSWLCWYQNRLLGGDYNDYSYGKRGQAYTDYYGNRLQSGILNPAYGFPVRPVKEK